MNGTLIRYESTSEGTFGIMTFGDLVLHTIEKPWINNTPFKSCIPSGDYTLTYFHRDNGDLVFALTGQGVTIKKEEGGKRYAILIHSGNYVKDIVGCIAPGIARHERMVTNSRHAMEKLMETVPENSTLTIKFGEVR